MLFAMRSTSFAPSCSVYQPPHAPRSLEIHCTQLFQSRLIVPRRSRHFVAVSVPAYGREKQWWRCRSRRVGGGRSGGVREPQLVLANDVTMRWPAGASRCHTYFSRNGWGRRGRTNRAAICSARQGVGARLRCHRCGSVHSPGNGELKFGLPSSPGTGRLWGARWLRNGPDGLVRARRCNTVIGVVRYDLIDEATRLSEARQAATRAARASKWLDLF